MTFLQDLLDQFKTAQKTPAGSSFTQNSRHSGGVGPGQSGYIEKSVNSEAYTQTPSVQSLAALFGQETPSMQVLLERNGAYILDRQAALEHIHGWVSLGADLQTGLAQFASAGTLPIQFLGIFHRNTRAWKWAWAYSWGQHRFGLSTWLPDTVTVCAKALHGLGITTNIDVLKQDSFTVSMEDIHALCLAACALFPSYVYHFHDFGDGIAVFLVEPPSQVFEWQMDPQRIKPTFMRLIELFSLNERQALSGYMARLGFILETADVDEKPVDLILEPSDMSLQKISMRWQHAETRVIATFSLDDRLDTLDISVE